MSWWNPFSSEAGNGKTQAELDAELRELDRQRAAQRETEARDFEDAGLQEEADASRAASLAWQRTHAENLERQAATDEATPWDVFQDELGNQADARRKTFTEIITTSVGTLFRLIPWPVWLGAAIWLAWQMGWLTKLFKKGKA